MHAQTPDAADLQPRPLCRAMSWSATSFRSAPTICGWGPTPKTSLPIRLINAASPAGGHRAKRVPGVAGDKIELGGLSPKLPLDIGVSLTRWLMMLHAVRAEASLEEIDNAAMIELTCLNFEQVVREAKQPKTGIAQLAQRER